MRAAAAAPPSPARAEARRERRERITVALLLAAAAVLFSAGLGRSALFDQDEAKYTQVAREILQTGDPITLHVNGAPWFVHPPLYMWLQAATGWAFGFSEFTARVWSAVFGVVGVLATYLLGRLLFNRRTAVLAAVVLMTMFQYFAQSRLVIFDVVLVAFMLLAFYAFVRAMREDRPRLLVWALVWAGLGTLTKGPIALLLPGLVAAGYLLLRRGAAERSRVLAWRPLAVGLLVYGIIGGTWYAVESIRHGWPFVQSVIGYYTLHRFFGVVEGQAGPWWYYGPVLAVGAFPWTAFAAAMAAYHARRWRDEGSLVVLGWCGITLLFYSVAGTKLPNYILPVYPAAALGVAVLWDRALAGEPQARRHLGLAFALTAAAVVLFIVPIVLFGQQVYPQAFADLQRHLLTLALAVAAVLAAAMGLHLARRPLASFAAVAGATVVLAAGIIGWTLPLVEAGRPQKAVGEALGAVWRPGTLVVGYRLADHQTLLYYSGQRIRWEDDLDALRRRVCAFPRALIASPVQAAPQLRAHLERSLGGALRPIIRRGHLVVFLKEGTRGCRSLPSPL